MKRSRWIAFLFLVVSIVAMLGIGLYLSTTHQGTHPVDSGSPENTPASPHQ
ncbi:hypothetical protein [Dyella sp. S184]|uniref:hypothetical protein n=1 Tax=Dyella sp. S184 TaxID=1641862 RepID=UPI00131BE9EE|nr:hypothetical protein [Dyella sp. S184]